MTWTNIRIIYSYHPLSFWIWLYTLKSILARNQIKSRMKHGWKKHTTKDRNEVWWDFLANVMLMTKVCVNIFQIKQVIAKNILVLIHVNKSYWWIMVFRIEIMHHRAQWAIFNRIFRCGYAPIEWRNSWRRYIGICKKI